jgi:formamidopyrimidine-DNA glycosylase
MLEIPESLTIARQINETLSGKKIINVTAGCTPHKFAWYYGEPSNYHGLLFGKTIDKATGYGSMVEILAGDAVILVSDGAALRYHSKKEERPKKHQLLIEFEDDSAISAAIQMYGGLWCFKQGEFDNPYYKVCKERYMPVSDEFNSTYFFSLISREEVQKLSAKAFLATEQRIPGLGNGVLQDILFDSKIHPKRKINTFSYDEKERLFNSVKSIVSEMVLQGGRDTEKDLFGCQGGYKTKLSKNTLDKPCSICGESIIKENYMGGSIYYCSGCQVI